MTTEAPQIAINRALKFARTFTHHDLVVRESSAASDSDIERYGTPNHTDYYDITIVIDWPSNQGGSVEGSSAKFNTKPSDHHSDSAVEMRIVCTSTDIVYYEFADGD